MKQHVILFDVHVPAHDKEIFHSICNVIAKIKPYGVHFGGDFLDLFSLGSYNADSLGKLREWTLEDEYNQGNIVLDQLDAVLTEKTVRKTFLFGNHEDRYFRERDKGDRDKYGGSLESPQKALKLDERGYTVLTRWKEDMIKIGKLNVMHGLYTPKHTACKHLEASGMNIIFGHTHRFQSFVDGNHGAWNCGFLGDLESPLFGYMPPFQRRQWVNGFAIVNEINKQGDFVVEPIQIWNKKVFYGGKQF